MLPHPMPGMGVGGVGGMPGRGGPDGSGGMVVGPNHPFFAGVAQILLHHGGQGQACLCMLAAGDSGV